MFSEELKVFSHHSYRICLSQPLLVLVMAASLIKYTDIVRKEMKALFGKEI